MKKLIDIPDELIAALKKAAKKDHRTPKTWIENLIIVELKKQVEKKE